MINLQNTINQMDVPTMRRDLANPANVRWLLRNVQVNNSKHPKIKEVLKALRALQKIKL